ncbi:sulfite reductase [Roseisalinus antarcticus]|uniref:Sulfite reductase n=1 Tax=Roseisalinus antarcticus TaxID=254357 RepID=A0A1Y5TL69_9RHOB|nr:hypothetical protein [Roseisalinus antarcticus]SLN62943.1 sulfite reductase [Roseisalinus antarcticus]
MPGGSRLWQRLRGAGFARFAAGDLIGILPAGGAVPRLYSLASGRGDGFVEIVVKKHPGGLCSGQLTALEPGETVTAFVRRNPGFKPGRGRGALILIGAGTGIGPLAGFVRGNAAEVARQIRAGARVMVCGGRGMAAGVAEALADILAPAGLTPARLKAEGRYVEDIY